MESVVGTSAGPEGLNGNDEFLEAQWRRVWEVKTPGRAHGRAPTRLSVLPLGALPAPHSEDQRKQSPPASMVGERQSNHT